jgi:hypothetical protein
MNILDFLSDLSGNTMCPDWSPSIAYIVVAVALPVCFGVFVGVALRLVEKVFGVELGRGGH